MNKIPHIPPFDIAGRKQREWDMLCLLAKKYDLLSFSLKYCETTGKIDFKYWDQKIEQCLLTFSLDQEKLVPDFDTKDPVLIDILKDKLVWLEQKIVQGSYKNKIRLLKELWFTHHYIENGYGAVNQLVAPEYEAVLHGERQILVDNNKLSIEDVESVDNEIRIFYIDEELFTRKMGRETIKLTKEQLDEIVDRKIVSYAKIIKLLQRKQELLKKRLSEYTEESIESIDDQLSIWRLDIEIAGKKLFCERYNERKEILP